METGFFRNRFGFKCTKYCLVPGNYIVVSNKIIHKFQKRNKEGDLGGPLTMDLEIECSHKTRLLIRAACRF